MKNKAFDQYLDHPTHMPEDADERALAELLEEVSAMESPDPGQDYWNQFNSRLQSRLNEEPRHRFRLRTWLFAGGFATATAAVWLVMLLAPLQQSGPDLAELDNDSLAFLSQVYGDYAEDGWSESLADADADLLLETYEFEDDGMFPLEDELSPADAEALKAMWKEG